MKIKFYFLILVASLFVMATSCQTKTNNKEKLAPNVHKVTAEEVIQSSSYTYLRVSEDGKENWIAISRQPAEKGKTYYYEPSIEMTDFVSKELKRTFPSIIFVDKFSEQPIVAIDSMPAGTSKGNAPAVAKEGIKVEPAEGGITIAELYANRASYEGKQVRIRGEVVKFSSQIMGVNWAHLQDGTNSNGSFDITVTTIETTKVGDVVTFEGTVTLKKDFGAGYFYEVIVENGKLIQ